jgi:hypothetical protein
MPKRFTDFRNGTYLKEADLDKSAPVKHPRFWRRQFSDATSTYQTIFDIGAGVIIPILLLVFDPAVFRSQGCYGVPVLNNYAIFAYVAIGLGTLSLIVWLFTRAVRLGGAAFLSGVLLTGGLFAAGIGVALLPYSLLGLIIVIGVLGLFPFVTAFVYFRNGIRALRKARMVTKNSARLFATALVGSVLVIGLPVLAQVQVTSMIQRSLDKITENWSDPATPAIDELRTVNLACLHLCTSTIAQAFEREVTTHSAQEQRLAEIYQQITGEVLYTYTCSGGD